MAWEVRALTQGSVETTSLPCIIQKAPFLSLFPNSALSESNQQQQQQKGAKKSSFTFLVTLATSSPLATSCPSPCVSSAQLSILLGHKPSLWQIRHHCYPTTYSLPAFVGGGVFSGLPPWDWRNCLGVAQINLWSYFFRFGLIWLAVLVEKPIGEGQKNLSPSLMA